MVILQAVCENVLLKEEVVAFDKKAWKLIFLKLTSETETWLGNDKIGWISQQCTVCSDKKYS